MVERTGIAGRRANANTNRGRGLEPTTLKDAATFVAEMTPVVGDAMAAKEIYDEVNKENPNWLMVGALGGATAIGMIPGVGDAAATLIRQGARRAMPSSATTLPTPTRGRTDEAFGYDLDTTNDLPAPTTNTVGLYDAPKYPDADGVLQSHPSTPEQGYEDLLSNERAAPVLEVIPRDSLMALAGSKPHNLDFDNFEMWRDSIENLALNAGVDPMSTKAVVESLSTYYPKPVNTVRDEFAERAIPYKAPIGQAGRQQVDPQGLRTSPSTTDEQARALGFNDTVYHTTTSPEEFDSFRLDTDATPDADRKSQDFLGVHVGTPRAAGERSVDVRRQGFNDAERGITMEMRARTDKPADSQTLGKFLGMDEANLGSGPLAEEDIGAAVDKYRDMIYPDVDLNTIGVEQQLEMDEVAAVLLRQDLSEAGFTHIPYFNNIEDPGSVSYIMLTDRGGDSASVLRNSRAAFDPAKVNEPNLNFNMGGLVSDGEPKGYAEGGLVSKNAISDYFLASSGRMTEMEFTGKHKMSTLEFERQFQEDNNVDITGTESLAEVNTQPKGNTMPFKKEPQAYAVGGPVERDPVSGNHVPPGSSPENVRDDIPAMLSEGEYVVPADVLKYFGVNFFEELRMKAKEGMMSMEQEGRIDGDPVMPQMAEGGLVAEQGTFDPSNWSTPGLGGKGLGSSAYEYKEFVGPAGDIQMILFVNGSAAQNIPNGYRDSSLPAATPTPVAAALPARERNDSNAGQSEANRNRMALGDVGTGSGTSFGNPLGDLDFTDPTSIQEWADNKLSENWINRGAKVAGGLTMGMLGAKGVNTAIELRNIAEVNAAAKYYQHLGNTDMAENLFTQAKAWGEEYGFVGKQGAEAFATGEGIYNSYRDSLGGNPVSVPSQRRDTSAGLDVARQLNADAGQSYADTGTTRDTTWDGGSVATNQNYSYKNDSDGHARAARDARSRAKSAADRDGLEMATSGRNKGGLVTRPKK